MSGAIARTLAALAALAATALLVAVLAWWGWRAFGPAPVHIPPAAPADPVATILASGLLAGPGAPPPAAPSKDEATLAAGDTRLLGVLSQRDGQGYALFRLPTGARLVAAGQEIAQGAQLVAVRPDGVTIRDAGGERRVVLRGEPPAKAPPPTTVAARATRSNPACAVPAGFKGTVLRVNAELFQGIIAKPESWAALVNADRGALSVRDESGFVTMLAMKKGDRLEQANGVALAVPDDIARAVLQPLSTQQAVRITGARDGQPREWFLLNSGSCPA